MSDRPTISIRDAADSDWPAVEALFASTFATIRDIYRPTPEAERRQKRRFRDGHRLVALFDKTIVGTLQLVWRPRHVFVSGLAVHPDCQRRGVARALIEAVITLAKRRGYAQIKLETIEQTGNVPIFEKLGFQITGSAEPDWCVSDQYDALVSVEMRRELS